MKKQNYAIWIQIVSMSVLKLKIFMMTLQDNEMRSHTANQKDHFQKEKTKNHWFDKS